MKTNKTILVMDEDTQVSEYLSDMIRYFGFDVECVDSIADAMRRLTKRSFDGLLLEMWMSDGTGRALLAWLRENGHEEPVIMMSATADYEQWIDLVNRGAADLLAKPIEPPQLKRALQMALGERYFCEKGWQPALGI